MKKQRFQKIKKLAVLISFFGVFMLSTSLPAKSISHNNPWIEKGFRGGGIFDDWNQRRIQELMEECEKQIDSQKIKIEQKQILKESVAEELRILEQLKKDLESLKKKQKNI